MFPEHFAGMDSLWLPVVDSNNLPGCYGTQATCIPNVQPQQNRHCQNCKFSDLLEEIMHN